MSGAAETPPSLPAAVVGPEEAPARRWLLIKAKAGLGNRMLSAVTGLIYAELTGRAPVIDWRDGMYANPGVNAYHLLFDAPELTEPEALPTCPASVAPPIWRDALESHPDVLIARNDPKRHSDPLLYRKYCVDLATLDRDSEIAVFWSYLPKLGRLRRHMGRVPAFAGRSSDEVLRDYLRTYFTPNAGVRTAIQNLIPAAQRPVIGVHIRHTDMVTPLERFRTAIRRRLDATPNASIYLATDNPKVEAEFRAAFPRVFCAPKWFPSDGKNIHYHTGEVDRLREAENALIDMGALARCDQLIYSRNSTFSLISALTGDFAPGAVEDVDARNIRIRLKRFVQSYL